MKIATWNINSVRLRIRQVTRFLQKHQPDVLCLQEIKCRADQFPHKPFERLGYTSRVVNGQKGYHGVATVSRLPFHESANRAFCGKDDARHAAVTVGEGKNATTIHNFYVPAGGDEPDPTVNEKFAHKLDFLDEMAGWLNGSGGSDARVVITGDLNVAPLENDVWSHRQLLRVVSHTPVETERLEAMRESGQWTDAIRHFHPPEEKVFTWWSYRAQNWRASNKGRRLDHIWVSRAMTDDLTSLEIDSTTRDWKRPSDHVPVVVEIGA